jgi:hypothetical protein
LFGLAAYVYSYSSAGFCYRYSREGMKNCFGQKSFSSVKTCSVSRTAYPSVSYLSQKVMSEVSVSRRRRSPSARSALPLTCTPSFQDPAIEVVEKCERCSGRKTFSEENFDAEGVPPF